MLLFVQCIVYIMFVKLLFNKLINQVNRYFTIQGVSKERRPLEIKHIVKI